MKFHGKPLYKIVVFFTTDRVHTLAHLVPIEACRGYLYTLKEAHSRVWKVPEEDIHIAVESERIDLSKTSNHLNMLRDAEEKIRSFYLL